jgi:polysaccharide chain length determinant protein (PEP-CTERM system associated)
VVANPNDPNTDPNTEIQEQMDRIEQQILSRSRLLRVIDQMGLYPKDRKRMADDDLVDKMRKDIDIEPVRSENRRVSAFNIYYTSLDPKTAQLATAELANLFIAQDQEDRQARMGNANKFLNDQLDRSRRKLAVQEGRVRDFKAQHSGELPAQTQSNLTILTGLQTQMQAQEDSLNRAKQQNTYLESLLGEYRTLGPVTKNGDGGTDPLSAIDKELDRLNAQLADLRSRYTEKHPDVRKTKEAIANAERTRAGIVAEMNNAASAPPAAGSNDPKSATQRDLESQLKANRGEIVNRQAEVKNLLGQIADYQNRLNRTPVMEQQFADLSRDYDQSKADYDSLLAKKSQSQMATDLEKTQSGENFQVLDPPSLPTKPYKPKRLPLSALGLLVGLVVGSAAAFGQEKLSGRLYSEREIKKIMPFEVIVEIPPIETPGEQQLRQRGNWMAAAAAVAVASLVLAGSAITYLYG